MILLLDNYDSFTFNLLHYVEMLTSEPVKVFRNDEITVEEAALYQTFIFSPGPGLPGESGNMIALIRRYATEKKMLGVCLGMQAIGEAFGARLKNLETVYHGVSRNVIVTDNSESLFNDIPKRFKAGRYHSWVIDNDSLPPMLLSTAVDENGELMAIRHNQFKIKGVQFHPESILTEHGLKLIENFLKFP